MGMYSMSPSLSGGMNSCPSVIAAGAAASRAASPIAIVVLGFLSATHANG